MVKRLPNQNFTIAFIAFLMLFFFYIINQIDILPTPVKIGITLAWGAFSMLLVYTSYYIRLQQHQRAFSGKKQATDSIDSRQQRTVEIDLPRSDSLWE